MRKIIVTFLFIFVFISQLCFARVEPLANEDLDGIYAKSIERVLRSDPEEIDLGTAALIISEKWSDLVHGRRHLAELDDMAIEIRQRIQDKKIRGAHKKISLINDYLFNELKFETVAEATNPDDLFLHTVLDQKRGYCLSLSVLYLSIGERLGLPLHGVVVPGHFFVRYDDGKVRFNIEATSKGGTVDDQYYIEKYKVPQNSRENIYMANLDKRRTLGCFFNNLGNSYDDIGDTDAAILALERAVQINPTLSESRMNLGNLYLKTNDIEDAIDQYLLALRINPNDAKTHTNLGNAYVRKNNLTDAVSEYLVAQRLDSNYTDAYKNLAIAYCQQKKYSLALSQLNQALALEPGNADIYNQLAGTYRQMDNIDEAIIHYRNALQFNRQLAEAHLGLGLCYKRQGYTDEEILEYKKALAIDPDMTAAIVNLGSAYFNKEQYSKAADQYKKALRISPDDSGIYYNLGAAYSNMDLFDEAAAEYKKSLELDPQNGDTHNSLAIVYYHLKKYDLALEHLETARQLGTKI